MILPLGKSCSILTKFYIGIVTQKLAHLDIDRYFYVLYTLSHSEKPMCQKDLADSVSVDSVSMVRIADHLSEKGYLKRVQSEADRRAYHLELTGKALAIIPDIRQAFHEADKICYSGLNKSEKQQFRKLLGQIHLNLENHPRDEVKLNYKKIKSISQ